MSVTIMFLKQNIVGNVFKTISQCLWFCFWKKMKNPIRFYQDSFGIFYFWPLTVFSTIHFISFKTICARDSLTSPSRWTSVKFNFFVEKTNNSIWSMYGTIHCPPVQYKASISKSGCSKGPLNLKNKLKNNIVLIW